MKQKLRFSEIAMKAFQHIESEKTMLDVDLMIRLDFIPTTWKVWKPKLIQKLTNITLPKTGAEKGDYTKVKTSYSKKEDTWKSTELLE
jgi:hypothetical protein